MLNADLRSETSAFARDGYATASWQFSPSEVGCLQSEVARLCAGDRDDIVREADGRTVRAIHGCHMYSEMFARLIRAPAILSLARDAIGTTDVYVYQLKVNIKAARTGDAWPWHQDYAFWHHEDGMPSSSAVNVAIFLDQVTPENGPLTVIPGSQQFGLLDVPTRTQDADWADHVSSNLAYTVADTTAERLARAHGIVDLTGPAGTVALFHPSIVHRSNQNKSPDRRSILYITYNSSDNGPAEFRRPPFLVSRSSDPLHDGSGDVFLTDSASPSDM